MTQLMYGRNVAKQLLTDPRKVHRVYLAGTDRELEAMCRKHNIRVEHTDRRSLNKLAGTDRHQGVVVEIDPYKTVPVADLVNGRKGEYGFIILLDEANLSPMEYYWSDFMNICDDLGPQSTVNLGENYVFGIPETLHFVATINNDHTTETLSPRLIDRAERGDDGHYVASSSVGPDRQTCADYYDAYYRYSDELIQKGDSRELSEDCDLVQTLQTYTK